MSGDSTPKPGSEIVATIAEAIGSRQWHAVSMDLSAGWSAIVRVRSHSETPPSGATTYWIFSVDYEKRRVYLSNSDFGQLPISDRMRPRYIAALEQILVVLSEEDNSHSVDSIANALSEVKGMLNRCLLKNQPDWLSVYEALGCPAHRWLKRVVGELSNFRVALVHGDDEAAGKHKHRLLELGADKCFASTHNAVTKDTPRLRNAKQFAERTTAQKRVVKNAQSREIGSIVDAESRRKLERDNAEHARALAALARYLTKKGYLVEENRYVDAFCRLRSGPTIFEVKSISQENELSQARHALGQLYEYRFRHDLAEASLWVVLSRKPQVEYWLIEYLREDRRINMLWLEDESLAGPDLLLLTESGSEARRRQGSPGDQA